MASFVAVIGDLVGSRLHSSRGEVQQGLLDAIGQVNQRVQAEQPLEPTIGDELQGVYATVNQALCATLVLRLALPDFMDVRCGLGIGVIEVVGRSAYGLTQDGSAWWSARAAVDTVKQAQRRIPALRTRLFSSFTEPGGPDPMQPALNQPDGAIQEDADVIDVQVLDYANAYLVSRDEIVTRLDGRGRRLAIGLLDGRTYADLAKQEHISPSAVSQRVRRDGLASLVESVRQVSQ